MHTLTDIEYRVEAKPFLQKVFVNDDPFDQPFSPSITTRRIIYPCHGDISEALPIEALIAAASSLGDTGCYISVLWGSPNKPCHCYVPLSEMLEGYAGSPGSAQLIGAKLGMNPYSLHSIIYSAQGRWGIMTSHEGHGLLGGPPEFLKKIRQAVPDLDTQVYGFLQKLRWLLEDAGMGSDVSQNEWLPGLLAHVYGQELAEKMLREAKRP